MCFSYLNYCTYLTILAVCGSYRKFIREYVGGPELIDDALLIKYLCCNLELKRHVNGQLDYSLSIRS